MNTDVLFDEFNESSINEAIRLFLETNQQYLPPIELTHKVNTGDVLGRIANGRV